MTTKHATLQAMMRSTVLAGLVTLALPVQAALVSTAESFVRGTVAIDGVGLTGLEFSYSSPVTSETRIVGGPGSLADLSGTDEPAPLTVGPDGVETINWVANALTETDAADGTSTAARSLAGTFDFINTGTAALTFDINLSWTLEALVFTEDWMRDFARASAALCIEVRGSTTQCDQLRTDVSVDSDIEMMSGDLESITDSSLDFLGFTLAAGEAFSLDLFVDVFAESGTSKVPEPATLGLLVLLAAALLASRVAPRESAFARVRH